MYFFKGSGKEQFPLSSLLPIKSDQNVVETLKSATKWNAKNRPGMSADVFGGHNDCHHRRRMYHSNRLI